MIENVPVPPARKFFRNVYWFYRFDCCWPYALSFFLVLVIYWLDFFFARTPYRLASLTAYLIILAYYLYNLRCFFTTGLNTRDDAFFIKYLSSKIIIWGLLLLSLYISG
ncbi:MAG TPA: hypothetical protein DCZ92_04780 [Elusimicrobia bacterium]|nr:MAG: hypothetical protein A2016_03580 [Elusimicrobia bacterium GWF2_62_30]HBA60123.1 hypothetical protein [Elusimicrobiota bacterium]